MTAPTVTVYQSTDASAPVLTGGAAGNLIALLYACLVTGYGSKSGAGWTRPYTAASNCDAVFLNASPLLPKDLQVFDNGITDTIIGAAGTQEAVACGFESCSSAATVGGQANGTNPFPTIAQNASLITIRKSNTNNSTARPWVLVATNAFFHLFINSGDLTAPSYSYFCFGDFWDYCQGNYGTLIGGITTPNSGTAANENMAKAYGIMTGASTVLAGCYIDRNYDGISLSMPASRLIDGSKNSVTTTATIMGSTQTMAYPNPPDGGLWMSEVWLVQYNSSGAVYSLRGKIPGLWCPMHTMPLTNLSPFNGVNNVAGKSYLALNVASTGQVMIETSSTWSS